MSDNVLMDALRLGVSVRGDFDQGAYGRYDEPVYCGVVAYFYNTPFDKTPPGRGETPEIAIHDLFSKVKDKQRLEHLRAKL